MVLMVVKLLGGIGLFLTGMVLLTDGLKAFSGDALRRALLQFTGTPFKAFASGTLLTLLVQSSAATTITLIGFVSAGLLSFPQAVGVVMGASLGTTGTGWLISLLGLKVSLGLYTMPLIGIGALMKLLARGRVRALGMALSGFGIMFVGIDFMQQGMQTLSEHFSLRAMDMDSLGIRLATMLIGMVVTVMMQSSTAVVAMTLTALSTGTVSFEQGAVLVIGAAIGTTMTGVLAAIGGSVLAKRTALAHVLFNLSTGSLALLLLPAFMKALGWAQHYLGLQPGAVSLVAFHTLFIGVGVCLFLPFAAPFAHLIERLLPSKPDTLVNLLDESQLQVPEVALDTTHKALERISLEMFDLLATAAQCPLRNDGQVLVLDEHKVKKLKLALRQVRDFFARIPIDEESAYLMPRRLEQMHAIDHLVRLQSRLKLPEQLCDIGINPQATEGAAIARQVLEEARRAVEDPAVAHAEAEAMAAQTARLLELRQQVRLAVLRESAGGHRDSFDAMKVMDVMRWLERVAYHSWRVCHSLSGGTTPEPEQADLD